MKLNDVDIQAQLVSGTSIKTVNSTSLLGSGNVAVQETLVSGTSIKTVNSTSLLGSGNLVVGDLKGINNIFPGQSGNTITNRFMGTSTNFVTYTNNIIRLHPYMPHSTFTTSSLAVQILTGQTGAAIRLLIYNNSATKPSGKLFESTSISCATSGLKTVSTSFTFTAGTIYWLGFQNSLSGTSATIASLTSANLIPFLGDASSNSAYIGYETSAYSYGSAPTTMGAVTAVDSNFPLYWITIA